MNYCTYMIFETFKDFDIAQMVLLVSVEHELAVRAGLKMHTNQSRSHPTLTLVHFIHPRNTTVYCIL